MNNQIAKVSQSTDLSIQLSLKDNEVAVALTGRMIKDIDRQYLFNIFKHSINRAYLLIRYEAPLELQLIIDETMKLAQNNYGTIREGEVEIALTRGALGDYGTDFKGLSVVTFIGFIKAYLKEETRSQLLAAQVKQYDPEPPTYNEIFDMAKGNALKALNDVKTGRDITLSGSAVYDWLSGLGLIEFTGKEKKEFFEEARLDLVNEYGMKNINETDRYKRIDNKMIIDSLNSEAPVSEDIYKKVLSRAKCLTLRAFLEGIIIEEIDLDSLIETKRDESGSLAETGQNT